jgi:pyruvate dehydrogenase (quinone)
MKTSLSGNLATMCPGIPYAVAAKFAYPERVVFALVGDGAMQMLGINVMITISKFWKRWADPRLIILVLNNQDLNQVTWEQRVTGNPKFTGSQDVPDFPYDKYAELLGLKGLRMEKPEDINYVWDAALSSDRPVVINAYTDPNVPTLPPHITFEQAKAYSEAILKGDVDSIGMIKQTIKDAAESYIPH